MEELAYNREKAAGVVQRHPTARLGDGDYARGTVTMRVRGLCLTKRSVDSTIQDFAPARGSPRHDLLALPHVGLKTVGGRTDRLR